MSVAGRLGWPGLLCAALAAAAPAGAQAPAVPDSGRSILDGVYTQAQAERGRGIFARECAACHERGQFADRRFLRSWAGGSVFLLFDLIRSSMPQDRPATLEPGEYADVVAYLFRLSRLPAGECELGTRPDVLERIRIEPPAEAGPP